MRPLAKKIEKENHLRHVAPMYPNTQKPSKNIRLYEKVIENDRGGKTQEDWCLKSQTESK